MRNIVKQLKKIGTLNVILIIVGLFFVWFNCQMLDIYRAQGSIPEGYAIAVIGATIGECGICGWIRINKDKMQDRKWVKEDRKEEEKREQKRIKDYDIEL